MNNLNKFASIILLFLILSKVVLGQSDFTSETISIKDGLSNNVITDILQDSYGYIWISTFDGVNVYDGYNFRIYKNIPNDSTSLPNNRTFRMLEDRKGEIWISTDEGLVKYDRKTDEMTTYLYSTSSAELANQVIHIYEDRKDNLWVNTGSGILLFDRTKEEFLRHDVLQVDNSVATFVNYGGIITENSNGDLYCTSQSFGLLRFDYESNLFVEVPLKENGNEKIRLNRYYDIVADKNNNLWLGLATGFFKVDLKSNTIKDLTPYKKIVAQNRFVDNAVSGLLLDSTNTMWIGTGRNGLYTYDLETQTFEQKREASPEAFYTAFWQDKSGILWYGSTRGVTKNDFDRKPFVTFSLEDDENSNRKEIFAFSKSITKPHKVWISTALGLYQFDNQKNTLVKGSKIYRGLAEFNDIGIFTVLETEQGLMWLATVRDGLFSYDMKSGRINQYSHEFYNKTSIYHNTIHNLAINNNSDLWIATHTGLNILKKGDKEFTSLPSFTNRNYHTKLIDKIKSLRTKSNPTSSIIEVGDYADLSREFVLRNDARVIIYSIGEGLAQWNMVDYGWLESENGDTLWTAGEYLESFHASGGLKNRMKIGFMELKAGRYKLRYKSDDSHSVESYNQLPPQDSTYWGTQIFTLQDQEYEEYKRIYKESEEMTYLSGDDIKVIFCDTNNEVWIGTDDGLSHIDLNYRIINYENDPTDPTSISDNNVREIKKDLSGNLWIATNNGLNKFIKETGTFSAYHDSDGLPSSNISSIEVDEKGDLWVSSLKGISKIELNAEGNIQIIVNFDVKDGLQGYEFIQSSSFKDKSGKLYFGGIDGFNAFYPGKSNKTPPFLSMKDVKISNKSIKQSDAYGSSNLSPISSLALSHSQNDLSFEFASIHYSRPDKNRVKYMMEGIDEDWITTERRFATYTNLDPGDYLFKIMASNGDGVWNENIHEVNISISPPWYNNWIAYSIYTAMFFGLLFSVRKFEMTRQQKNAQIAESRLKIEAAEALAQAAESDKRTLQIEFEHKKKELEEARELQLSMLPKELPALPNLDIAVYMKTATEVGGDYYDFNIGLDGTLTVVLGDATGHGMKAGTMVTTTKSLFNVLAPNPNIVETFHEMTRCLKLMHMQKLSMCMTMLKIMENKVQMSSAGMPPIFIYKRENQSTEEHVIKGMPLGTFNNFPYKIIESELNSGDVILLMSDGFPELLNDKNEIYGYKRARNYFEEIAGQSPEEIISKLRSAGSEWANDKDPDDDVTFVVIKVK